MHKRPIWREPRRAHRRYAETVLNRQTSSFGPCFPTLLSTWHGIPLVHSRARSCRVAETVATMATKSDGVMFKERNIDVFSLCVLLLRRCPPSSVSAHASLQDIPFGRAHRLLVEVWLSLVAWWPLGWRWLAAESAASIASIISRAIAQPPLSVVIT